MAIDLPTYRAHRAAMISGPDGIRAYRVSGLVRHCEYHRDMQNSLIELRNAYYGNK